MPAVLHALNHLEQFDCGEAAPPAVRDRRLRKDMRYLVAYDICSSSRLRRVATVCEDYGCRVQKSVFECDLEPNTFESFWSEVNNEIDDDEDFLVAYVLCKSCSSRVLSAGVMSRPETVIAYVV
jgi:CRISPR-associated protein Cas2